MRLDHHWISRMFPTTPKGVVVSACPLVAACQISVESCFANAWLTKVASKIAVCIAMILVCAGFTLNADTIISVDGPHGSTLALGATDQMLVTSWSSTNAYSDVNIDFHSNFGPFDGTAYLMTRIGPGTTAADEVVSNAYSATSGSPSLTRLFSGLTLGPGSYYLVVTSLPVGGWDTPYTAGSAVLSIGLGVTRGAQYIVNDGNGPPDLGYPPPSLFSELDFYDLEFQVTGSPTSSAPEPATLPWMGVGFMLIVAFKVTPRGSG
jgi:hypothetical protein